MTLNDYADEAHDFAKYETPEYPFFGLAEESGEVLGKIAKVYRKFVMDSPYALMEDEKIAIAYELGDVLWMLQECAFVIGYDLGVIAEMNLSKLRDRRTRDVIIGEGDKR